MEDAGDRPEGLRPAMMTWKSCENLRAGHCKWGDSCYYAHTQEESEVFAQWQKAKVRRAFQWFGGETRRVLHHALSGT